MISDVSSNLHTFFVPQMEQLGMKEQPSRHGSLSMRADAARRVSRRLRVRYIHDRLLSKAVSRAVPLSPGAQYPLLQAERRRCVVRPYAERVPPLVHAMHDTELLR